MSRQSTEIYAIQNLQRYLRQLSYDEEQIKAPPIDGVFEGETQDALRAFQALKGLPVTGVADQETWELLYTLYRASLAKNAPPRAVSVFPRTPESYALTPGSEGIAVSLLQHMLIELAYLYGDLGELSISGIYDAPTERAVSAFQDRNVLKKTGSVDRATWNQIADQFQGGGIGDS